ncbi:MAG: hypothetical protein EOM61_02700 [Bacteroidia bacterium]|nr:hypothetical protein [Bacteroidia bacterium]
MKTAIIFPLFFIFFLTITTAQEVVDEGRLVRLLRAETAESYQNENFNIRLVTGNAQFLHNGALIICDTAVWDLTQNTVDAKGNVRVMHQRNILAGDKIHYIADSSLAQVRGTIVELIDKDSNRLRTYFLDYNTKDSIAYFFNGGSMLDTTGNVIESLKGYYDSKLKRFKFLEQVEMTAEEMLLKCDSLAFWSEENRTDFLGKINGWQKDGFMSAGKGWYNREKEAYGFYQKAYLSNSTNEVWADSLVYEKTASLARFWDNVQLLDTAQSVILFADFATYSQNPVSAKLYDNPSMAYYSVEENIPDTLFFAADTIRYNTIEKHLADSATVAASQSRYLQAKRDPIKEMYGKKAVPGPPLPDTTAAAIKETLAIQADSTAIHRDSTALHRDSTAIQTDTTAIHIVPESLTANKTLSPPDTLSLKIDSIFVITDSTLIIADSTLLQSTEPQELVRFIEADNNIRFYRSNLQGKCDSLLFNSIDSTIRLFIDPVLWNEENQFTADSIQLVIQDKKLSKAELMSNAFFASQVDSTHYNQIRSTDIIAWFDKGELTRFDAFGGVTRMFFFDEDSILTTMNRMECRAMTATMEQKSVQIVKSYENLKNDGFPVIDLKPGEDKLKGLVVRENERPKSRYEVSKRIVLPTRRQESLAIELPQFPFTQNLFKFKPEVEGIVNKQPEKPENHFESHEKQPVKEEQVLPPTNSQNE